jgi:hypothetical protein
MTRRPHVPALRPAQARRLAARFLAGRFFAGIVALVCLAAQFSSFAHLLLVRHSVCREHGELIHDEPGDPSGSPRAALAAPSQKGPALEAAALGKGAHEHEHCAALSERRSRVASCPRETRLPAPAGREVAVVAVAPESRIFGGIPLVLLAPKNSPPALG